MAKTTVEVLKDARALAAERWVGINHACGYGNVIDGEIESCCTVGAVVAVMESDAIHEACLAPDAETEQSEPIQLLVDCAGASGVRSLEHWNDEATRTKDEVLGLFDCAIAKASA